MNRTITLSSLALIIAGSATAATIDSHTQVGSGSGISTAEDGIIVNTNYDDTGTLDWIDWNSGTTSNAGNDTFDAIDLTKVGAFTNVYTDYTGNILSMTGNGGVDFGVASVAALEAADDDTGVTITDAEGLNVGEGWTYTINLAAGDYILTNYFSGRRNDASIELKINDGGDDVIDSLTTDFNGSNSGNYNINNSITTSAFTLENAGTATITVLRTDTGEGGGHDWFGFKGSAISLVPEPGTYALISGFLALGFVAVRRRKA